MAVGDEESAKRTETLESLVAVLLSGSLVNRGVGLGGIARANLLSLPNEVLNEVALVLGQEQELGLLDNLLEVCGELLTLGGELLARRCETLPVVGSVHRHINLLVLRWVLALHEKGLDRFAP